MEFTRQCNIKQEAEATVFGWYRTGMSVCSDDKGRWQFAAQIKVLSCVCLFAGRAGTKG
jgi:hypothetical protein